jgi:hypothetical protein
MLHEHHIIYSVRYFMQFHITAVGFGTFCPRITGHYCTLHKIQTVSDIVIVIVGCAGVFLFSCVVVNTCLVKIMLQQNINCVISLI